MLKLENVSKLFNPGTPDEKIALLGIDLSFFLVILSPSLEVMELVNLR